MADVSAGPPPYVSVLDPGRCVVRSPWRLRAGLRAVGMRWQIDGSMVLRHRAPASAAELAALADRLRALGLAFLGQPHGWPPSAVLQALRDEGLLSGGFTEVTWSGPGRFRLRTA